MTTDWLTKPLDAQYLFDSGLLFEANRTIFHLVGLSLSVTKDASTGEMRFVVEDFRAAPEKVVFDRNTFLYGKAKLAAFMASLGDSQMIKREAALGKATQWSMDEKKNVKSK